MWLIGGKRISHRPYIDDTCGWANLVIFRCVTWKETAIQNRTLDHMCMMSRVTHTTICAQYINWSLWFMFLSFLSGIDWWFINLVLRARSTFKIIKASWYSHVCPEALQATLSHKCWIIIFRKSCLLIPGQIFFPLILRCISFFDSLALISIFNT